MRVTDAMVERACASGFLQLENAAYVRIEVRRILNAALADESELVYARHLAVANERIAELEAKLAKVRVAHARYQHRDLDREEFEGTIADVAENP